MALVPWDGPKEKTNYRSIGRGSGGVEIRRHGALPRRQRRPTASSIPAKFETVLYHDNHEKRGFCGYTPRFFTPLLEDKPGPGAYADDDLGNGETAAGGSVGTRGNGAFASRAKRLGPAARGGLPGPGSYDIAPVVERPGTPGGRPPSPSPAFVQPSSVNPAKFFERPSPGPGDYVPAQGAGDWSARGMRRAQNVLIGGAARSELLPGQPAKSEETPGPADYCVPPPGSHREFHHSSLVQSGLEGNWSQRHLLKANPKRHNSGWEQNFLMKLLARPRKSLLAQVIMTHSSAQ